MDRELSRDMLNDEFKYVFDSSKLKKGDILLMDTYHERQRSRMREDKYLHVAVYIGNAMIVEADGLGSVISHIYSYAFKAMEDACVVRVKNFNILLADKLQRCLREDLGREYGTREALKVDKLKSTEERDTSKHTFCSRNVAKAFEKCSIQLVHNPDYCSPDDLMKSDRVDIVRDAICEIPSDVREIVATHIKKREEPEMDLMPQLLFENVRNFFKSKNLVGPKYNIQNYSEMLIAISQSTEYDGELVELLKNHPCLRDPKEITKEHWPWFDENKEFLSHYGNTRDALFFIYNQIDHYDGLYLPTQRENFVYGVILSILRDDLESLRVLAENRKAIYRESIRIRRRIADLYYMLDQEYPQEVYLFQKEVGLPKRVDFEYPTLDISQLLYIPEDGLQKIQNYLKSHPDALNPEI